MEKGALFMTIVISVLGAVGPIRAEGHPTNAPDQLIEKKNEHVLDAMTQLLSLTKEQQATVKATLDDQATHLESAQRDYADKEKQIQDSTDSKINAVLNDNQKAKYPDVKAQLKKEEEPKPGKPKADNKGNNSNDEGKGQHQRHKRGGAVPY